ncbi:hypothetical protein GA0070616_4320 [Micromonospora nigra]|uniref:Uncharacterized protein n=1 Tax=Micromonospora nigra TaxID=145857 RepID=A0A1C6SQ69_9ACTN|nr:hypothetical protein [Micromonospora nigra]SCL31726.1 hypothetical protein GA0070616_4320 [Micromonospora nigra]
MRIGTLFSVFTAFVLLAAATLVAASPILPDLEVCRATAPVGVTGQLESLAAHLRR